MKLKIRSADRRRYDRAMKLKRRELHKLINTDQDWDYQYLHRLVVKKIGNMYDYYKKGDDVHYMPEDLKIVLKSLKCALCLAKKIEQAETSSEYEKRDRLYRAFYSHIGKHITMWWD